MKHLSSITALSFFAANLLVILPVHAASPSGYTSFRTVYAFDVGAGTYTDLTVPSGNITANDVPVGNQAGDVLYA